MNRFNDAVLDLVSSAPAATTVDGLRARIRRHRRQRAFAIVVVAGVISVTSVGIAASLGHKTSAPLIAVSPTTSTTVGRPRVSCPPMSRANAILRAKQMPGGSPTSPVRVKLMTWAELHAHVPDAPSPLLTATTQIWVVEVRNWYFHDEPGPAADQPKPFPWALFIIDAHTGAPYGPVTGPGNSTPYWDLLPDHSKSCATSSALPRPPVPVSARVLLPSRTMAAGSSMSGHVVVDNHTGHALHVYGCGRLFAVALGNDKVHPDVLWPLCRQPFTIPIGASSYPIQVEATYLACSPGRPQSNLIACKPNRQLPALPPGNYQAKLFQSSEIVPIPTPINVSVTPLLTP
jgi:hypothetical protein